MSQTQSNAWICKTCAAEYPAAPTPPLACPICEDERQWVPKDGQQWVRADTLPKSHTNRIEEIEPGLFGIGVEPKFGIGQIAFFIPSNEPGKGGIIWEGIPFYSPETINWLKEMGGVDTWIYSHPHLYGSIATNAAHFPDSKILVPEADNDWQPYPSNQYRYFNEKTLQLTDKVSVHVPGGQFPGSSFLHWTGTKDKKGALLTGDTMMVTADRKYVSFTYSTPNSVPLGPNAARRIVAASEPLTYDRIYSSWWDSCLLENAKERVAASEKRWNDILNAP